MGISIAIANAIGYQGGAGGALDASAWLLLDEFTSNVAAGSVNGTASEPGPGERTVLDSGDKLSLASGSMVIANSVGSQDPTLVFGPQSRVVGRLLLTDMTTISTGNQGRVGWGTAQDTSALDNGIRLVQTSSIGTQIAGTAGPVVGTFATATTYQIAVVLRDTGFLGFIKGGTYTYWTLLWVSDVGETATLYPGAQVIGAGRGFSTSRLGVPRAKWMPVPLISDGFSGSDESDGLGHTEGVAGGLGSGGGGVSWSSSWETGAGVVSAVISSPSELLADGGLEAWDSATELADWGEFVAGGSTVNREASEVHGGTYAVQFDVSGTNDLAKISQTIANSDGDWLLVTLWAKTDTVGRSIAVDENHGSNVGSTITLDTTYRPYTALIEATKANTNIGIKRSSAASATIYLDDISATVVDLPELIADVDLSTADAFVSVTLTSTVAGSLAGLVVSLDSHATPDNFVLVAVLWPNILIVAKVAGGVYTPVSTSSISVSGGEVLAVHKLGSAYRCYFDGDLVAAETISDAGIVDNTRHGLFSSDGASAFDDFVAYAVGTGGEYEAGIAGVAP